jgi:ubiquinone/menaquinone biosynthesis C-methylase UbiE
MVNEIDRIINQTNERIMKLNLDHALEEKRYNSDLIGGQSLMSLRYDNFWDSEAINWNERMTFEEKESIKEIMEENIQGKALSIGCGSNNYGFDWVIGLDSSWDMLAGNKSDVKVFYDLEKHILPFKNKSFDCIVAAFVINYIKNASALIKELKRILKDDGRLLVLQCGLNDWYKSKSLHSTDEISLIMKKQFTVENRKNGKIIYMKATK